MTPLGEHQLLVFWVQLALLLAVARGLGNTLRRFGQPGVVGELAAGLVVGPSVLGSVAPGVHAWIFPDDPVQGGLLLAVAWIGAALLLLVTGFETDLRLLAHLGRPAAFVATGSLLVPLVAGFGLGWAMPAGLIGAEGDTTSFAMFMAVALSISALPVIAKILIELGLMRRDLGQITVAAGMANDLVGWILLGVIAGLVAGGGFDLLGLGTTLLWLLGFLLLTLTAGQRLVDRWLRGARGERGSLRSFSVVVLVMLAAGALTQAIGVEAVLGAFVAGVVVGRSRYQRPEVARTLGTVTNAFLAPLFFATAGLFVDLRLLADPTAALWALAVIAVASVTKLAGSYVGARLGRLTNREGLAIGFGLNARGALEIIVATVGLGLGILNATSYTIVVVMAMTTSMMAPPLLRLVLRGYSGTPEETVRLEREAVLERSIVANVRTALLPTRGGDNSVLAGAILDLALQPDTAVTIYTVHDGSHSEARRSAQAAAVELTERFGSRASEHTDRTTTDVVAAILDEAALGYGLLAVGMTDGGLNPSGPSERLRDLVTSSPVPVLLVRHGVGLDAHAPRLRLRRILVPASGGRAARAAQEIAFTVARRVGAPVDVVHVVTRPDRAASMLYVDGLLQPVGPGLGTLQQASRLAQQFGASVTTHTRAGGSLGPELVDAADHNGADVIVLGARMRSYEGTPFLGHNVEYVLEAARQTVVVFVFPSTDPGRASGE